MDIGTLFQARNFLNARTVPASPMKDINACEELILKYSEALIITAFDKFKNETNINIVDTKDEIKNKELMETILNAVVDVYILPEVSEIYLKFVFNIESLVFYNGISLSINSFLINQFNINY